MRNRKGTDLEFICRINRDGSGVEKLTEKQIDSFKKYNYKLIRLSITENTYIASNMSLFVVKIKPNEIKS